MPWRKFSGLVIGKRTWCTIVSCVPEFAGDEPSPLRSLTKREAAAPSRPPNEFADMRFGSGLGKGPRGPKASEPSRDQGFVDPSERPNLEIGDSPHYRFCSLHQLNRRIGKVSGTQDDSLGF